MNRKLPAMASAVAATSFVAIMAVIAAPVASAASGTTAVSPSVPSSPAPSASGSATPTPAPTSPGKDDVNGCPAGHLPGVIEGKPASYRPGADRGEWIWHGKDGYSVRVTHKADGKRVEFSGEVRSSQPIVVKSVQLEKNDHYTLSSDHKTLRFDFANYGATDGIDFRADCAAKVSFEVSADRHRLSPVHVRLGAHAVAALSNPFTVQRRK